MSSRPRWSPLESATTPTGAWKAARALTNVGPEGDRENVGYFACMAEVLMAPLLYTAAINGRPMADVVRWVATRDRPKEGDVGEVAGLLEDELASSDPLRRSRAAEAMADLSAIWDGDERPRECVYAEAETRLRAWQ